MLSLPFFVPAIFTIAQTDLVLTVPRRLAKITARMAGGRIVEPPREIKAFPHFTQGIHDSALNLLTYGSVNNCGSLIRQSKQIGTLTELVRDET